MTKPSKASAFLENMNMGAASLASTSSVSPPQKPAPKAKPPATRLGLKHIGGYLDQDTVEKVAVLRVRLGLDNSELLTLAIDELHSKHKASRAFSD
jgi:hypothetical protein